MSNNTKIKQYAIVTILIVISVILVGLIYTSGHRKAEKNIALDSGQQAHAPNVEEIDMSEGHQEDISEDETIIVEEIDTSRIDFQTTDVTSDVETDIAVDPIEITDNSIGGASTVVVESIEEPMAVEPEKPDMTPPEHQPETTDDLTNGDQQPKYDEEQTTYVPEIVPEEALDEPRGTYTVPDSENPFLQENIPSNGYGGEMMGEDYDNGNPSGEGDKF